MNRYKVAITDGPVVSSIEVEADSSDEAREIAHAQHPGSTIGYPFRLGPMREVPKKRSGNSRYHLADVDKMGADGASPVPGSKIRPSGGRSRRRGR